MKQKIYVLTAAFAVLLLAAVLLAGPAAADDDMSAPVFPMQITGSAVDANGVPLPVGTKITATVDGITSEYIVTEAGKIGGSGTFGNKFLITGKEDGSIITFAVNGVESGQTATFGSDTKIEQPQLSFNVVVEENNAGMVGDGSDKKQSDEKKDDEKKTENSDKEAEKSVIEKNNPADEKTETQSPAINPTQKQASDSSATVQPTAVNVPVANVPVKSDAASTPIPFAGIITGLLAAGVFMRKFVQ